MHVTLTYSCKCLFPKKICGKVTHASLSVPPGCLQASLVHLPISIHPASNQLLHVTRKALSSSFSPHSFSFQLTVNHNLWSNICVLCTFTHHRWFWTKRWPTNWGARRLFLIKMGWLPSLTAIATMWICSGWAKSLSWRYVCLLLKPVISESTRTKTYCCLY